jgi:MFS family permease
MGRVMKLIIIVVLALDLIHRLTGGLSQDTFSWFLILFLTLTIIGTFFDKRWGRSLAWIYIAFLVFGSVGFIILAFILNTEISMLFFLRLIEGFTLTYILMKLTKTKSPNA